MTTSHTNSHTTSQSASQTTSHTTFCRVCEAACGLKVATQDNRIVSVEPDHYHVVTKGFVCAKGIRFADLHASPDRLRQPQKRVGDRWESISWEQAFKEIGEKVKQLREQHGRNSIALYMGNPAAFSMTHPVFCQAFLAGLDSEHFYSAGSQDCNNKFAVTQRVYGSPALQPIPDFDNVKCFIIVGSNPAVSHMSFLSVTRPIERLKAIEEKGGKVYFVNPRHTESVHRVGEQVFIRPGTDVFFLLSFLHELITTDGIRYDLIEKYMKNWSAVKQLAQAWTPERTETVTGISASQLRAMVKHYRTADGAALYCSTGVNQAQHSTLAYWILNVINAVSGNLDRQGGMLVPRGLLDAARVAKLAGIGERRTRSRIGNFESVMDGFPAGILPDEIFTPGPGQVRALFVSAGNPLLSCPNPARMASALKELELIVSVDMFRNETGNLAHYILPATSFFERPDLPMPVNGFQPVPYVQWSDAIVQPDGEQRDEWWIYTELAHACGARLFGHEMRGGWFADWFFRLNRKMEKLPVIGDRLRFRTEWMMQAMLLSARQPSLRRLRQQPHGVLLPPNRPQDFLGKRVLTADRKIDLAPAEFIAEADALDACFTQEQAQRDALKLISKRERFTHNSWMHNIEEFVKKRSTNFLYLHPEDATRAQLADGDLARVSTATGTVELPVKVTDEMMPRTVALPHGWGHQHADGLQIARQTTGVNVNQLMADGPDALEKFAGMVLMNGLVVDIKRVSSPGGENLSAERPSLQEISA